MADKELRRMNRTELIEIIYALQQSERVLRAENEELTNRLDERILRLDKSGSIAEAALSVNRIFEDAQDAADQYLQSTQVSAGNPYPAAVGIIADAYKRADAIISEAEARAKEICPDRENPSEEEPEAPEPQKSQEPPKSQEPLKSQESLESQEPLESQETPEEAGGQ